jgi:ABC-type transport system involved in multi-copper enzyme maturation permease subunit
MHRAGAEASENHRGARVVWDIAIKEITSNIRSHRILVALIAFASLMLLSAHLMAHDYKQRVDNWTISQTARQDPPFGGVVQYELTGGGFFHTAGVGHGPQMQRPHSLSVLVKGMETMVDRPVIISQRLGFGTRQEDNLVAALTETPDLLFITKLLVSLLALFFSVNAVTREKERGTLRALLAHPVRRREILLGKSAGISISLLVPLAVAFATAAVYLHQAEGLLRGPGDIPRTLLIFALTSLYGLAFVNLGLLISTLYARTKPAIVTALLVWGGLVLVIPNAAVLGASIISPAPSQSHLNASLHEAQRQVMEDQQRSNPGPVFDAANTRETVLEVIELDRRITDDYLSTKWRQIRLAERLLLASPAGAFAFGSSDLAGTGAASFKSYIDFLKSGRDEAIDALKSRFDLPAREGSQVVAATLERVNARQYAPDSTGASVRSALPATALLVLWTIAAGIGAFLRFESYDVR